MIDAADTRVLDRRHDAVGVALRRRAAIAGIDEHRFSRWRHEEGRIAPFDIHDVNVEGLRTALLGGRESDAHRRHHYDCEILRSDIGGLLVSGAPV